MKRLTIFSLALAVLCLQACARRSPPNIVLVVIDTLRPDRLGAYDPARHLTPFLDALAQQAYVFDHAYATTSWTSGSIASLLTSRYQSQHRVLTFQGALGADEITFPQVLKDHGYTTAAFSANFLLRADLGFGRGFDVYRTFSQFDPNGAERMKYSKERAGRIDHECLSWLDEQAQAHKPLPPLFLYLHYMEAHNPYEPPEEMLDVVLNGRPRPDREMVNSRMRLSNLGIFSDELVQNVKDLYDAEVMSLDRDLRELFAGLRARGVLDNAIVVITADHGEEFREHGLMGHFQTLYEEVLRIPLLISLPGQRQRVDVTQLVSLIDLGPTLLDLVDVPAPAAFMGHSLRPFMPLARTGWWPFGAEPSPPPGPGMVFSELIKAKETARERPHERAVIAGSRKLILNVDGTQEFYDLGADPGETNSQALSAADRADLMAAVERLQGYSRLATTANTPAQIDNETRERMRSLGYAE